MIELIDREKLHVGFKYTTELLDPSGRTISVETDHNIMPVQGMNHLLSVLLFGGTPFTSWYLGLFGNPHTPLPGDVMATFPTLAGEITAYSGAERLPFVGSAPDAGATSNLAAPAEFAFTAEDQVFGGFIAPAAAKGSGSGVLLSAVRFATPKNVEVGSILRVTAGFVLLSA